MDLINESYVDNHSALGPAQESNALLSDNLGACTNFLGHKVVAWLDEHDALFHKCIF